MGKLVGTKPHKTYI